MKLHFYIVTYLTVIILCFSKKYNHIKLMSIIIDVNEHPVEKGHKFSLITGDIWS